MLPQVRKWLEIRLGLDELIRSQLTEYRVPKNINLFYTLGMVAFAAFVFQVFTGILLLFYYIPDDKDAFQSIQLIMNQVPYGWLFRLMHVVGSNLMVAVVILHLGSVFFLGAYKKPRELTWVVGALLLLTTMGFCLSGYLLPWSQLSFWATTVVTNIPTAFPLCGDLVCEHLKGQRKRLRRHPEPLLCHACGLSAFAAGGALCPACLFGAPHRHLRPSLGGRQTPGMARNSGMKTIPTGCPFIPTLFPKKPS